MNVKCHPLHLHIALIASLLLASPVRAVDWSAPEVVATDVPALSSSAGPIASYTPSWSPWSALDQWHVVYVRGGEVYHRMRDTAGWHAEENVSQSAADSRNPKLAFAGAKLHVVWEDDRSGHSEVWTSRWDGAAWSAPECLTADGTVSVCPTLSAATFSALLVWQDGTDASARILARRWTSTGWGANEAVSSSPARAAQPSVSGEMAVWSDTRHGAAEIYFARRGANGVWGPNNRITNLSGACTNPDVHGEITGGDLGIRVYAVVFESEALGIPESWIACIEEDTVYDVTRLSADNHVASPRPAVAGHGYQVEVENSAGVVGRWYTTWAEGTTNQVADHHACEQSAGPATSLTTVGVTASAISATVHGAYAQLMSLWVENHSGTPTLVASTSKTAARVSVQVEAAQTLSLSPDGSLPTVVRLTNGYDPGHGVPGIARFLMSNDLAGHLQWDRDQPLPPLDIAIPEDGVIDLALQGGGCWAGGTADISWEGWGIVTWTGAHSPDIDGDCAVTASDYDYVEARLGGLDFCADVDGSGLVDAADLALVSARLGTQCSGLVSVDPPRDAGLRVDVAPNPFSDETRVMLRGVASGPAELSIFDAAGRRVRSLGSGTTRAGVASWSWDGTDDRGEPVASGIYFVGIRTGSGAVHRRVVLVAH